MTMWNTIDTAPRDGTAIWLLVDSQPYIGYCEPADWLHDHDRWFAKATFVRRGTHKTTAIRRRRTMFTVVTASMFSLAIIAKSRAHGEQGDGK